MEYNKPELTVVYFQEEDIIRTSSTGTGEDFHEGRDGDMNGGYVEGIWG